MSVELTTLNLEDALEVLIDYRGKTPKKTTSGIPLVTAKIVKAGKILSTEEFIAEEDFDSWMVRGLPKPGDVVLTTEAPLGEVAQIRDLPVALAQRIVTLRGKKGLLLNDYLKYLLLSPQMQEKLHGRSSGSTVVGIKQSELRKIEIQLPSVNYQSKVASILKALDNQIDNLEFQNSTLESIAQTLFKSWFINFDPVHAKAAGREPEGLCAEIAALFPSEFEESEIGLIPKGWSVKNVESVIQREKVGKKYDQKTVKSTGKVPVFDQGKSGVIGFHDEEPGVKASIENPVCLFSNHTCYFRYIASDFSAIQNVLPYRGAEKINIDWLWCATNGIQKFFEYKGHWPDFMLKKIVVPDSAPMEKFSEITRPIFKSIWSNEDSIKCLTSIRDELLPRLISGKIRIEEAEEALADVMPSTEKQVA